MSLFLFAFPASTNYSLRDYEIGGGGQGNASSAQYRMEAMVGETMAGSASGTNYRSGHGLQYVNQAHVPSALTFDNPNGDFDKLRLILDPASNPTDAVFAIAISVDDFATTRFVQDDMTIGATLGSEDYMTYAQLGGVSGTFIIGLSADTEYTVKIKAMHGGKTETGYGPTASASTALSQMSFDIDVSASDTETVPPYAFDLGDIFPGSVVTGSERIWMDVATNAANGADVYIRSQNAGLLSLAASATIASVSGDLGAVDEGFGVQGASVGQISGGPLSLVSPYDGSGDDVGPVDGTLREVLSAPAGISGGRGSVVVKAKSSVETPVESDYFETITAIAAARF